MGWFGSLDLAYKYSLVFGSALVLTLILGLIKLLADRRKMKKLMKDLESVPGRKATIDHGQPELNMREKDEGDLFGIRAIEAGFYGGVAQSTPNSVANSPAGSRAASPTPGKRTPQSHSPSSSITVVPSRPPTSSNLSHSKNLSDSDSPLGSSQPTHSPNRPEFMQANHLRSTSHNSGMVVRSPLGQSTLGHTFSPKLRPSQAELSGRIKHAPIDTPLDVPPFPVPSNHPSPTPSEQEYSTSSVIRTSDDSFQYSPDNLAESRSPVPSTLNMATHIGTSPFSVVPLSDNPHVEVQSRRASLVSYATVADQMGPLSTDTQDEPSPTFPNVDQSSSARDLDGVLAENRRGHFNNRESSLPPTRSAPAHNMSESPTMTTTPFEDHQHPRRTSVSFSLTGPDAYDPENAAFNSHPRPGDAPKSTTNAKASENQNLGTYQPKGYPSSRMI
jgi:hypothetical protein